MFLLWKCLIFNVWIIIHINKLFSIKYFYNWNLVKTVQYLIFEKIRIIKLLIIMAFVKKNEGL